MVVELDRIFCNHDMHFVPSASFPKAIPLSGQQQTVAHQIDGCVGEIPACHIHEHFHLRMQQGFATKQLYFLDAVLCPHELGHSATISFEHRKFRIGFRSERREIVTSTRWKCRISIMSFRFIFLRVHKAHSGRSSLRMSTNL